MIPCDVCGNPAVVLLTDQGHCRTFRCEPHRFLESWEGALRIESLLQRAELVQPLYLGFFSTWWRYGASTTVKQYNRNGAWCCNTHLKTDCECVRAVQEYDAKHGHDESGFYRISTLISK